MTIKSKLTFEVRGMTCVQCEKNIQKSLNTQAGISQVSVSFKTNKINVIFCPEIISRDEIKNIIEKCGYEVLLSRDSNHNKKLSYLQVIGAAIILIAIYLIISNTIGFNTAPEMQASMGYGMLFVVGLLTSIHCIAMCGGINLSQCIKSNPTNKSKNIYKASLLYNSGRVISYTIVGAIVGGIGAIISFAGPSKGIVSIIAGIFMIIMGINIMGILPQLRKFNIQIPSGLRMLFMGKKAERGPFIVGLLNGLMPCGPLQTMQLYALGTGSALSGALSMFAFSVGTVPLMFGFGALSTLLSKNFTKNMMKISALLVITLGIIMLQRGVVLSGISFDSSTANSIESEELEYNGEIVDGIQTLTAEVKSNSYPEILIKKDIPTKINFQVSEKNLNGCNNTIIIPEYGIEKELEVGDNWIEFTPTKSGEFKYSCWMGMIKSKVVVTI